MSRNWSGARPLGRMEFFMAKSGCRLWGLFRFEAFQVFFQFLDAAVEGLVALFVRARFLFATLFQHRAARRPFAERLLVHLRRGVALQRRARADLVLPAQADGADVVATPAPPGFRRLEHLLGLFFERIAPQVTAQLLRRQRLPQAVRAQQQHVAAVQQGFPAETDRGLVRAADAFQ